VFKAIKIKSDMPKLQETSLNSDGQQIQFLYFSQKKKKK
jgi:hypothetical protein